ncbi:MAG: hypothetical protein GY795_03935 [Desulfobacterales bacterium]|nr:hypothetical protein [Desulfobacterales bacterium]
MPWLELKAGGLTDPNEEQNLTVINSKHNVSVFLTGDGHSEPPFLWTEHSVLTRDILPKLINKNLVCAYVETYNNEVTADDVPDWMLKVFQNKKVFGWELDFFRLIKDLNDASQNWRMNLNNKKYDHNKALITIDGLLEQVIKRRGEVNMTGKMLNAAQSFRTNSKPYIVESQGYMSYAASFVHTPKKNEQKKNPTHNDYNRLAEQSRNVKDELLNLRDRCNRSFAASIWKYMKNYEHHLHFIACGDAHVKIDPIQNYLNLPKKETGIVDSGAYRNLKGKKKKVKKEPPKSLHWW